MSPAGEHSEAPAFGRSAREEGLGGFAIVPARADSRAIRPHHGDGENPRGVNARRESAASGVSALRGTDSPGRGRL